MTIENVNGIMVNDIIVNGFSAGKTCSINPLAGRLYENSKIERVIAGYDPQSPEYQDVFFGGLLPLVVIFNSRLRGNDRVLTARAPLGQGFALFGLLGRFYLR